jgi:RHS repeat-associated protein
LSSSGVSGITIAGQRRTKVAYPDGTYSYFKYDLVSNLTGALDARGWTYFSYDALNRPTQESQPGFSVSHAYDAVGNRSKLSLGGGEPAQYFRYDALRRMTAVASVPVGAGGYGIQGYGSTPYGGGGANIPGTGAAHYAYDAASRRTKLLQGSGVATYFSYDSANRLASQKSILPGGTALTYFSYGYDAASRITKIAREGAKTIYCSYDGADRLTGENWYNSGMQNVYAFAWSYDAAGNRHWQNRLGQQSYFSYDAANALRKSLPVGGSVTYYSYDPNGNCAKIFAANGATYFAYNGLNLMTSVLFRTGVVNYFWYDAKQRRYAIQESTGTTYFTYDTDGLCELLERNSSGTIVAEYTRGYAPTKGIGDRTGAKLITSQGTYYQYDGSDLPGNIRRITNSQGVVTGSFEYNAWGEKLLNQPPPEGTRFSFSAPAWVTLQDDPDNRWLITPTRMCDSSTGRFVQRDRQGLDGDYSYAATNPIIRVDPWGLADACPCSTDADEKTKKDLKEATKDALTGLAKDLATSYPELAKDTNVFAEYITGAGILANVVNNIKDGLQKGAEDPDCKKFIRAIVRAAKKKKPSTDDCDLIRDFGTHCALAIQKQGLSSVNWAAVDIFKARLVSKCLCAALARDR